MKKALTFLLFSETHFIYSLIACSMNKENPWEICEKKRDRMNNGFYFLFSGEMGFIKIYSW